MINLPTNEVFGMRLPEETKQEHTVLYLKRQKPDFFGIQRILLPLFPQNDPYQNTPCTVLCFSIQTLGSQAGLLSDLEAINQRFQEWLHSVLLCFASLCRWFVLLYFMLNTALWVFNELLHPFVSLKMN